MQATMAKPGGSTTPTSDSQKRRYIFAWFLCLIFYALEYASRSAATHGFEAVMPLIRLHPF